MLEFAGFGLAFVGVVVAVFAFVLGDREPGSKNAARNAIGYSSLVFAAVFFIIGLLAFLNGTKPPDSPPTQTAIAAPTAPKQSEPPRSRIQLTETTTPPTPVWPTQQPTGAPLPEPTTAPPPSPTKAPPAPQPTETPRPKPITTLTPTPTMPPPSPTSVQASAPTTANTVWRQGSIRAEAGFEYVGDTSFKLWFKITNEGASAFIARFRMEDFSVADDTGKTYISDNSPGPKTTQISANSYDSYGLYFKGTLNPNARKLILRLALLSGYPDIIAQIPISR